MSGVPTRRLSPRWGVGLAAIGGAGVTLLSLVPVTHVAYRSPTLHVAIEMAAALAGLLVAVLLFGRYLRTPMRSDLLLAAALLLLSLTNLFFSVIPWITDATRGSFDTWAPIAGRLLGATGLAVGALMTQLPVRRPRRWLFVALGGVGVLLVALAGLATLLAPQLPVGIDPNVPPDPAGPDLVGEPSVLATQVMGMALYAVAAFGFARRAERTADELMAWLAAACTLAAFSRLNYFLFPSLYSEWVYAGDFLRIAFFVVILAGVLREITAHQRELAEMAVHRERRRIARELHDGVAQDLAFILSQARRLDTSDISSGIADAAARALSESRQAIATLARPVDASLDASIAQAAEEMAVRDDVRLKLDLAPGLQVQDRVHDAVMRIVREAVHNAARHGHAKEVAVALRLEDGIHLSIEDDGEGLATETTNGGSGFGLVSMRERAEALGGKLEVTRGAGRGVRVEVWLP